MAKKFLGGAFVRGDAFNTCGGWNWDGDSNANGRFAKPLRNWRGKVVGYVEETSRLDVDVLPGESLAVRKAVRAWTSPWGKFMRGLRLFKMGWNR